MPEMNGYEFCKKIKSDEKLRNIPIILLTMLSEPEDVMKGLESGADNFMTKPYDEELLMARIHYVLINVELRESRTNEMGIEIMFAGKKHFITSNRIQILDLLISTYENAIQKTREPEKTIMELTHANETIKTLKGLIPICASCKKVRNDAGYWEQIEMYIREHSEAEFTHGFCPDCMKKLYPKHAK
jgi:DNA-binding response OmpR family regulator